MHETAVSHVVKRLKATRPRKPWDETREQFTSRMKDIVADVNKCVDLLGISCEYPTRLEALLEKEGDRLRK